MKVFEPLNVYEKCKVFMCSMRCSDNQAELLCMIQSLNEILLNKKTRKEIRIILLKEHLSYLLKLTSSSTDQTTPGSSFLSINTENGLELISSLLDLLESMVVLMSEDSKETETLTIYVHILGMYLNEESSSSRKSIELNDIVIKKLINLGLNYKQELKHVLDKWPNLKTKIGNALKSSANKSTSQNENNPDSSNDQANSGGRQTQNKTPKIQLNFNFSKK